MSVPDVLVTVAGLGLIGWELWFFLVPPKGRGTAAAAKGGVQEITVRVKGGYEPDTILVEAGRPVRLHFYRDETADCSERVVFESLGIDQVLPPFRTTDIEFTPTEPGDYPFRCGMSMLKGRVVAQVGREAARLNLGRGHSKHA